jgi:predicted aspartyl protease
MKRTVMAIFLIAFLSSTVAFAQVENRPIKGTIPFELREHLIVIEVKINGSAKSYNFVLDTGGLTFIDRKIAEELGLKIRGNMAKMDTLVMGEVSIPDIFAVMGFDFKKFERYGISLSGIIGSNLLERFKVAIDYRNQRVILSPDQEDSKESAPGYRFKFTSHQINHAPMIDCLINDTVSLKAMVDTGQPYSVVFPLDYLDSMGLRDDPSLVRSKGVMIDWPGTKTKDVYLGRIGQWTQGGLQTRDLMCLFAELPAPLSVPLLGKDYLSQFLMTIDYPNHEILFVPYEDASFVKDLFSFGLNLGKGENDAIIVDGLWAGGPSDKAGIEVGEEIIACNGRPFNGDTIFQLRHLVSDEKVEEVKLVVKKDTVRREVLLRKETLLSRGRRNDCAQIVLTSGAADTPLLPNTFEGTLHWTFSPASRFLASSTSGKPGSAFFHRSRNFW